MNRQKPYGKIFLTRSGWSDLIKFLQVHFPNPTSLSAESWVNDGNWEYDNFSDFLLNMRPDHCRVAIHSSEPAKAELLVIHGMSGLTFDYDSTDQKRIAAFELCFDELVREKSEKRAKDKPLLKPKLFIGHGRHADWRDLKDHLADKHGIEVECYETGSRVGHTIRDILESMMTSSSLAVLIHTPEDEMADGSKSARPNVIHETGLFQGRLGFPRAILLMKEGVNEFSNVYGVQQIRYADIRQTYGEVLAWIRRETESKPS